MKKSLIYAVIGGGITAVLAVILLSNPLTLNHPPDVTVSPLKNVLAGPKVTLTLDKASDQDGDLLTYNWTQLSGEQVLLFNSNTSNPNFAISPSATNRTLSFQVNVSDGKVTKPAIVNVLIAANKPPVADAGKDQTVNKDDRVVLDGSGSSDPENTQLIYSWVQTGGQEVQISNVSAARPNFIAPSLSDQKTLTFELTVNDGIVDSKPSSVKITVKPDKQPVADAGPDQTVKKGETATLSGLGSSDPDKDKLTYQWTQTSGPDVKLSDPKAAKTTFVAPSFPDDRVLAFQLVVSDGTLDSKPAAVKITVKANRPPVADAGKDQTVGEQDQVTLDGTGSSDPDKDKLTYQWTQTSGPDVKLSDPKAIKPTFKAPLVDSDKVLTFQLVVNDGTDDSKPAAVKITVKASKPPVADAGADRDITGGTTITLDGSKSSDPAGKKLTYLWKQTSGPTVKLSDPKAIKPTFLAPSREKTDIVLIFQLVVNNGDSNSTASTVKLTIPANKAPIADAGKDQTAVARSRVNLDGSASKDPNGDKISYSWRQVSGPPAALVGETNAKPYFIAPDVARQQVLVFELTVSDGDLTDKNTVQITVNVK